MIVQPTLIRNYMTPPGEWASLLLLANDQVHIPAPGLLQVLGPFCGDGDGGAIVAAMGVNSRWGYLNALGQWVVEPTLEYAYAFSDEGLSQFCVGGLWGYRNLKGQIVIAAQYARTEAFQHGLAAVKLGSGKWRYIDTGGAFAFDAEFSFAKSFSALGLASAVGTSKRTSKQYGYIDRTGAWAIAPRFDYAESFSREGVAPAQVDKRYGIIDRQGEWILAPCHEWMNAFNTDGLAFFKADWRHHGYLDAGGVPVIRDMDRLSQTMRHGIAVEANRTYMSAQGALALDVRLDWCDDFNEHGFAVARAGAPPGHDIAEVPVWGIVRADASFSAAPPDVLEPVTGQHGVVFGAEPNTPLVAFLARDRSVAMLDRDARAIYRLRAETGPDGAYAALYDEGNRLLWQGPACPVLYRPLHYFSKNADALLVEVRSLDALAGLAESMVDATRDKLRDIDARLTALDSGEEEDDGEPVYKAGHDDPDEYDDDDSFKARLAKSLRTTRRIFRSYLDEDENGRYEFLGPERDIMMETTYARCVALLTERFGPGERDPDYAGVAAMPATTAWPVPLDAPLPGDDGTRPESQRLWLGIASNTDTGDGDVWHHIWLVCAPSRETLEAALGERCVAEDEDDDDDDGDEDNTAWLRTVAGGAASPAGEAALLRELESRPLMLAKIPQRHITRAMVELAVGADPRAAQFVPRRLMTGELYALALTQGDKAFRQLPPAVMSEALCLAAVNDWTYHLRHVPPEQRTLALCIASVQKHSWVLEHVPAPLKDAVLAALARPKEH